VDLRAFRFWVALAGALLGLTPAASAQSERITSFNSAGTVYRNGEIEVTETIIVRAEGRVIRRGIFRDLPTQRGRYWYGPHRVGFDVVSVTRDGQPEPWRLERRGYYARIYIGDPDVFLRSGNYTYTLTYRTDRQIAFLPDRDELEWNVTGNFWAFPIDRATATIRAPAGHQVIDLSAVTGAFGDRGRAAVAEITDIGVGTVETTAVLGAGEGVTLTAAFPPGSVTPPDRPAQLAYLLRDGRTVWIGLIGLLVVVAYYLTVWWEYGKDPEPDTIYARYTPPEGIGPAACRYILNMGWDPKGFTAAIVNLAAKGFVTISEFDRDKYKLTRTDRSAKQSELTPGETAVALRLFGEKLWTSFVFRSEHHAIVEGARKDLRRSLKEDFENIYFHKNKTLLSVGTGLSATALGSMAAVSDTGLAMGIVAAAAAMLGYALYPLCLGAWTRFGRGEGAVISFSSTMFFALILGGQIIGEAGVSVITWLTTAPPLEIGLIVFVVALNLLFYHLMKAPSLMGRKVMDHVEGFRHYLQVAEKDRMNFHNPPDITPEIFEAYLPFAIALDVENEWGEQFDLSLDRVGGQRYRDSYEPSWYDSDYHTWPTPRAFAADFAPTFGQSVVSSLSPLASMRGAGIGSGGFSGGGFSGGGGGGGGGGGW